MQSLVKKRSGKAKNPRADSNERRQNGGQSGTGLRRASWQEALRTVLGIDPRSLALFRISMGVLLLVDLCVRATDLTAMYTDKGMFPRATICRHYSTIWDWSFHFGGGGASYQEFLFAIAAALALALLVGFETRLATIGSWLLLISLHHRVPPILSGADVLMRMLMFWAMFLPLETVWSLDNRLRKRAKEPGGTAFEPVLSVGSAAILLQMALMYLFSAIFKSNESWLRGRVVEGALSHNFYASSLAPWLLHFPALLTVITWGSFLLEWTAPILLFFPKGTARLRLGLVSALAAMHVGIALCLEVDLFSPVSLAGLSLFLPAEFWNSRWLRRFSGSAEPGLRAKIGQRSQVRPWGYVPQGICLVMLLYVVANNINSLPSHPLSVDPPARKGFFWTAFGLGQKWSMFDGVPTKNGWYMARAKLMDGSEVDLLRKGAPLDWNKPRFPASMFPNYRWRKCFREMAYTDQVGYQVFRAPVAEFLCRDWNARHPRDQQVFEFDLIYCNEGDVPAPGATPQIVVREQLLHLDYSIAERDHPIVSGL